jgi:hypothetical protein
MLKYLYILFVFLSFETDVFPQDTLVLQGHYYGKNLYVLNPSLGSDTSFCIQKVLIDGQPSKDELHSNSFEIDFSLMSILNGAAVKVSIIHDPKCHPKIVNPEVIQLQSTFAFINSKIDKSGKIIWTVKGDVYSSFVIEQYRWQKWVTAGEVDIADTIKKNMYSFEPKLNSGLNQFRISHTDEKGNIVYSKLIKFRSVIKEVFLTTTKVTDEITFTDETAYEIFDDNGTFISDGYGSSVSITDLPKGKYWINYDNKTEMVTKK